MLAKLKDRGIRTIDADDIVHEALGPDTPTTRSIAAQLGSAFVGADGSVDRALLATLVFASPTCACGWRPSSIQWCIALSTTGSTPSIAPGVASIPLLYETGHERDFDVVVVTVCAPEIQIARMIHRDRMYGGRRAARLDAQMPAAEKASRGDFVIETGGTMPETDRQVDEFLVTLD